MEGAKKKSPSSSRRGLVRVPIRKGPERLNPVSKSERRIGTVAHNNKVLNGFHRLGLYDFRRLCKDFAQTSDYYAKRFKKNSYICLITIRIAGG